MDRDRIDPYGFGRRDGPARPLLVLGYMYQSGERKGRRPWLRVSSTTTPKCTTMRNRSYPMPRDRSIYRILANFVWAYATVERASPRLFGALAQASLASSRRFVAEGRRLAYALLLTARGPHAGIVTC